MFRRHVHFRLGNVGIESPTRHAESVCHSETRCRHAWLHGSGVNPSAETIRDSETRGTATRVRRCGAEAHDTRVEVPACHASTWRADPGYFA